MASLLKIFLSKCSYKKISFRSLTSFPCYLCDEKFSSYPKIEIHVNDFECLVRDPLYPPSKHLPTKLGKPEILNEDPYAKCLPNGVYLAYDPQETKKLVSMLRRFHDAVFLIYVDSPQRATSLEVILKSCFQRCTSMHYLMTVSARSTMVKIVKNGFVRILITTDLEEESLDMGIVDFIIHYDFLFPNLHLFMKRTLVQFGVPTKGVFIYYPESSNSPSSVASSVFPFEDPFKRISRIIHIENRLVGNFIGKGGQTLKYFGRDAGVNFKIAEPNGTLRSIEIMGTPFAINKALILITKVLSKAESGYDMRSKFQGDNGGGLVNGAGLDLLWEKMRQVSAVKDVAPVKGGGGLVNGTNLDLLWEKMCQMLSAVKDVAPVKDGGGLVKDVAPFAEGKAGSGCLYVEVSMDRGPYLRKVDLKSYSNYMELTSAIERMFSCFTIGQCSSHGVPGREGLTESQLKDLLHGSEYVLTYEDKDSDWRLVGDVPWDLFTDSCRRLRIMKGSDAIGLVVFSISEAHK